MGFSKVTDERAKKAFPILVSLAKTAGKITYGDLAKKLGCHHRPIRFVAGCLRDNYCVPNGWPLLNSLIVNKDTGLPGESYLPTGMSNTAQGNYNKTVGAIQRKVYQYPYWDNVLKTLGL